MNLYYFYDHHGNFGDALNDWLWDALFPNRVNNAADLWLSGIGTILNHKMPLGRRWIIMGSGVGYGGLPADFGHANWDILALRGPLSARRLGVNAGLAITDGAMLLSLLNDYSPDICCASRSGIAFIPHYMSVRGSAWREVCALAGVKYIDPCSDTHEILTAIRTSKLVIADAMHGAIVADVLRTPWIPVSINRTTDSFKWTDWCLSMRLKHEPYKLEPSSLCDVIRARTVGFYGENFFADGIGADELCRRHAQRSTKAGSPVKDLFNKLIKRAVREVAECSMDVESRVNGNAARQRIERAAINLRSVTQKPACLSSDAIFAENRERMAAALFTLSRKHDLSTSKNLIT